MSHYTVLCVLEHAENVEDQLEALLAPYDENIEVKPYEDDGETTTYNPDSKWDWYTVGGRWSGYFDVLPDRAQHPSLLYASADWNTPPAEEIAGKVNGGNKCALDLDGMRRRARERAARGYDLVQSHLAGTPAARPWSEYAELAKAETITWEQARDLYGAQPRVRAFRDEGLRDVVGFLGVLDDYDMPREQFLRRAEAAAVPGYAFLSEQTGWVAPGNMGWFGMSDDDHSSQAGYWEFVNGHINVLPDEAFLVIVDCHI